MYIKLRKKQPNKIKYNRHLWRHLNAAANGVDKMNLSDPKSPPIPFQMLRRSNLVLLGPPLWFQRLPLRRLSRLSPEKPAMGRL